MLRDDPAIGAKLDTWEQQAVIEDTGAKDSNR